MLLGFFHHLLTLIEQTIWKSWTRRSEPQGQHPWVCTTVQQTGHGWKQLACQYSLITLEQQRSQKKMKEQNERTIRYSYSIVHKNYFSLKLLFSSTLVPKNVCLLHVIPDSFVELFHSHIFVLSKTLQWNSLLPCKICCLLYTCTLLSTFTKVWVRPVKSLGEHPCIYHTPRCSLPWTVKYLLPYIYFPRKNGCKQPYRFHSPIISTMWSFSFCCSVLRAAERESWEGNIFIFCFTSLERDNHSFPKSSVVISIGLKFSTNHSKIKNSSE